MRNLIIAIFIFISAIIQFTILYTISFFNIRPDILLILVVFLNLYLPFKKGLVIGGICGVLKDIFSSGVFGLNLLSFVICIFIIKGIKKYLYKEDHSMRILIIFLISLINSTIYCIFKTAFFGLTFAYPFALIIFFESVYTALISPVIFIPFRKCVLKLST